VLHSIIHFSQVTNLEFVSKHVKAEHNLTERIENETRSTLWYFIRKGVGVFMKHSRREIFGSFSATFSSCCASSLPKQFHNPI
jgi:hypothetical protein